VARILLCYDGTPGARRALDRMPRIVHAGDVVALLGVEPPIPKGAAAADDPNVGSSAVADMRASIDEAIELLETHNIKASVIQLNGHPADEILDAAEAGNFDVLVIGAGENHGGGLRRRLHGSVASKVASEAPCDVYIAH
jgi:nucleotide-binding universal stress UspA family protein